MASPSPEISASYGRSCEECVRSKCKCILRPGGGSCERCHRLQRQCRPSASKRRRAGVKAASQQGSRITEVVNRTAQLEEKLDQLVAALQPRMNFNGSSTASSVSTQATGPRLDLRSSPGNLVQHASPVDSDAVSTAAAADNFSSSDVWRAAKVTLHTADECLSTFKTHHLNWFPFCYIPPNLGAQQLCAERPIFWLSIVTICSTPPSEKLRLCQLFRQTIAQKMVVQSEKSIDLLLGLLAFVGWYHNYSLRPDGTTRLSLSLLTQMAISLVFDLRRPVHIQSQRLLNSQLHRHQQSPRAQCSNAVTMEERRAFLGCFLLTSTISQTLGRIDPLRWTNHLDACLQEIEAKQEWLGDVILVQQVRMQLVVEKAALLTWYDTSLGANEHFRAPPSSHIQALHAQLQGVKSAFPPRINENYLLRLQYHSTELAITEPAISRFADMGQSPHTNLHQHNHRFTCLGIIKSWFSIYFSISPTEYQAQCFSVSLGSIRCMGTLLYLSTLNEPGWSKEAVRAQLDPLLVLDKMIAALEIAVEALGLEDEDILSRTCQMYRSVRPYWVAKLAEDEHLPQASPPSSETSRINPAPLGPIDLDEMTLGELGDIDFLNDTQWWMGWPTVNGLTSAPM